MLVGVDVALLVAENLDSLWAGKKLWIWLRWEQAGSSGYGFDGSTESGFAMSWQQALDLTYLPQLWHALSHRSDMLTLPSLTMWLHWEQGGSGESSLAVWGGTGFAGSSWSGLAGSKLVVVDMASLVAENQNSLWAGMKLWMWLRSHNPDMFHLTALTCSFLPDNLVLQGAVAVDLALLRVGRGVLHTAHGGTF